jgi:hypothetical protein
MAHIGLPPLIAACKAHPQGKILLVGPLLAKKSSGHCFFSELDEIHIWKRFVL